MASSAEKARNQISHSLDNAISAGAIIAEKFVNNPQKDSIQEKLDTVRELLNELYWSLGDPEALGQTEAK